MNQRSSNLGILALLLTSILVATLAGTPQAMADIITFNLDTGNGAISGCCTGPFVEVEVNRTSATTATITFTSLENGGNVYLMTDGSSAAVNVNSSSFTVPTFNGTNTYTGFTTPGPLTVQNPPGTSNVNGFGSFNLVIDSFDSFTHSLSEISFDISSPTSNWLTASQVLLANANGAIAASHIGACDLPCSITTGFSTTGFSAGSGNPTVPPIEVPEPSTLFLLGSGLVVVSTLARFRSRLRK